VIPTTPPSRWVAPKREVPEPFTEETPAPPVR
jgi:hypothetical protein